MEEDALQVNERVVYVRPSWDPKGQGIRRGTVVAVIPRIQSVNVPSMGQQYRYDVKWDGVPTVECGYGRNNLYREKDVISEIHGS